MVGIGEPYLIFHSLPKSQNYRSICWLFHTNRLEALSGKDSHDAKQDPLTLGVETIPDLDNPIWIHLSVRQRSVICLNKATESQLEILSFSGQGYCHDTVTLHQPRRAVDMVRKCAQSVLSSCSFQIKLPPQDSYYGHEQTAKTCARYINNLLHCPNQPPPLTPSITAPSPMHQASPPHQLDVPHSPAQLRGWQC